MTLKSTKEQFHFKAKIYKVGINACVDVPAAVTEKLLKDKGYIRIKGKINGANFKKSLVPVKDKPYRLYVDLTMLKKAETAVGKTADFFITQDKNKTKKDYPLPGILLEKLNENKVAEDFNNLSPARKKDILKYLNSIKREETLLKNVGKVIDQLLKKQKNVRIP